MRNFSLKRKITITFLIVILDIFTLAHAMRVQPMQLEMQSLGNASTSTIVVENEGSNNLPVELAIEELNLDIIGTPSYQSAEDNWLIFPPQAIIPPHGVQNFRLQWLGEPDLTQSKSFHLAIKQVPVEITKDQSGIQLVYNIRALVNVAPPNADAELVVAKVTKPEVESLNKQQTISLLLENPSRKHAMFSNYNLTLSIVDKSGRELWSESYSNNDIFQVVGVGMVQPNSQRAFKIPVHLPSNEFAVENSLKATVTESGL